LLSLVGAYTAYLGAEISLQVSGVMAVLACGLILGRLLRHQKTAQTPAYAFVAQTWELLAYIASALVFLLMGVTITLSMFEERWLAMLIGIGGVLCARAVSVYSGFPLLGLMPGIRRFPAAEQGLLVWGGLRGAVTLALALSLPLELDYWWTVQSIAFGVVVFSLFVQAPTLPILIRRADKSATPP
jgi:CPA1 family monovalent cation:H+ antiporter